MRLGSPIGAGLESRVAFSVRDEPPKAQAQVRLGSSFGAGLESRVAFSVRDEPPKAQAQVRVKGRVMVSVKGRG